MTSLQGLFRNYEPSDLTFPSTQVPNTANRASNKPTATFHVRSSARRLFKSYTILTSSRTCKCTWVTHSWTKDAMLTSVGAKWTAYGGPTRCGTTSACEKSSDDLTGVSSQQLFGSVNLVTSRGYNKLKPKAYPQRGYSQSGLTLPVDVIRYGAITSLGSPGRQLACG